MPVRTRPRLGLECLEGRLTPTISIINSTTAKFTDIDGDHATIKVSAGVLTAGLFTVLSTPFGDQLQRVNFTGGGFDGVDLTIHAVKGDFGDGVVNVGHIDSTGHDLGAVRVTGDLGRIEAGDSDPVAPALKSLTVGSLGRFGTDTQVAGGSLYTIIFGALGALTVRGDVVAAKVEVQSTTGSVRIGGSLVGGTEDMSGSITSYGMGRVRIGGHVLGGTALLSGTIYCPGRLESITIGGSLVGGLGQASGRILADSLGVVRVGHDVRGGAGSNSGLIESQGTLTGVNVGGSLIGGSDASGVIVAKELGRVQIGHDILGGEGLTSGSIVGLTDIEAVTVGGSLIGGSAQESGRIINLGDDLGRVRIGHSLKGGTGPMSGRIQSLGRLAVVTVGGSLVGGPGQESAQILSAGDMGAVRVAHNLIGGSISGIMPSLDRSGYIESGGRIASVFVGGSIISGTDTSLAGSLTRNASIRAGNDIGAVTVRGGLIGNRNVFGNSPVVIAARGREFPAPGSDVAIGKISIGGGVEFARILAGYDVDLVPVNADAQVGPVVVGGDWAASSLAAGVVDGGDGFGNANDVKISGPGTTNNGSIHSRIASVTIKGRAYGTPESAIAGDMYGFVAQEVGALKVGQTKIPLTPGPATDTVGFSLGLSSDMRLREVSL